MKRLTDNKLIVDIQILDNEASAENKQAIKTKWNAIYQLVPPNIGCREFDNRKSVV